jgi:(1->4)-alpha-D-glucan 1-alpha-D-glucosylmutase
MLLAACPDLDRRAAEGVTTELVVAWPVYRTYVRPDRDEVHPEDLEVIDHAVGRVRARDVVDPVLLDRVRELLVLEDRSDDADAFVWAFQQLTGPAIAKGVEDTVLYRDLRFVAVNEVGGDPSHLGRSVGDLHVLNVETQIHKPASMLLSSTHDTKRSEDVRARLAVLSQEPDRWVRTVLAWRDQAARHRGSSGPTPAHEHLTFQTLVGTWPIDADRLTAYLRKAAREGKDATDWLDPDVAYEADLERYARGLLGDPAFVAAVEAVVEEVREPGWLTSLSMTLLKLTSPRVPDTYQGCELWDLSLVDPDNRRPVDHDRTAVGSSRSSVATPRPRRCSHGSTRGSPSSGWCGRRSPFGPNDPTRSARGHLRAALGTGGPGPAGRRLRPQRRGDRRRTAAGAPARSELRGVGLGRDPPGAPARPVDRPADRRGGDR